MDNMVMNAKTVSREIDVIYHKCPNDREACLEISAIIFSAISFLQTCQNQEDINHVKLYCKKVWELFENAEYIVLDEVLLISKKLHFDIFKANSNMILHLSKKMMACRISKSDNNDSMLSSETIAQITGLSLYFLGEISLNSLSERVADKVAKMPARI
jgi:hypothetical protein